MQRIIGILKPIFTGVLYVAALATMVTNAIIAYLVLAPDDMPKPFYFAYADPPVVMVDVTLDDDGLEVDDSGEEGHSDAFSMESIISGQGITLDTGVRTYNMAEPGGRRYIKIGVVIEFAPKDDDYYTLYADTHLTSHDTGEVAEDDGHGEVEEVVDPLDTFIQQFNLKVNSKIFPINDTLLSVISSKSFSDIETSDGKDSLRNEIIDVLNSILPEYHVINVFFTEFVIQ